MNRFRRILGLAFAAFAFPLMAQIPSGFVQTTWTVAGIANWSFSTAWTNLSSSSQLPLLGGQSTFPITTTGQVSLAGTGTTLLADTSQIVPSPSTWTFQFTCPAGYIGGFSVQVAVTGGGGTEDISSQITAALPTTPCTATGGGGGGGGSATWNSITGGQQTGSGTSQLNTLPGALTLGVSPALGDNSLSVPTTSWVNGEIAQGGAWPITPQFEYFAYNSSGSTLVDSGPNGYNGTFGSGVNAPVFTAGGVGILFDQTAHSQWINIPFGALNGVQSLLLFYTPIYPNSYSTTGNPRELISDCANYGISGEESRFGMEAIMNGYVPFEGNNEATDRLVGNVAVGFTWPVASNPVIYPWGHGATSYFLRYPTGPIFSCASGPGAIGNNPNYEANNWYGTNFVFYGAIGFSSVLTAQQMKQAITYGSNLIQQAGGPAFIEPQYPSLYIYDGDSRMVNYTSYTLIGSRPWQISSLVSNSEQFYNWGIAGQTLTTINSNFSTVTAPYLRRIATANKVVTLDAITNDIKNGSCTTASGCYSLIQTYASNVSAVAPGSTTVYSTSLPRDDFSSANETLRESTMASVSSGALAGTFNFTGVDDIANDPIAATQTVPNSYAAATSINVSSATGTGSVATLTLASAVPSYECFAGAVWTIAGVTPSGYNATVSLNSCSGSTISYPNTTISAGSGGTATYNYNLAWYLDGIHEGPDLIAEMASQEAASQLAAQGRMKTCTLITKTIPWQVLAASQATTQATTQTIPLLQLWPGWQVCSVQANVTTPFSGSGISALTMSLGDSNGTTTQYSPAGSITSSGWAVTPNTDVLVPSTPKGMVQMNFTATGANVANVSAGQMTITIGVVKP